MTQAELFALLLITACMLILASRELAQRRIAMAALLAVIPAIGWLSILLGR